MGVGMKLRKDPNDGADTTGPARVADTANPPRIGTSGSPRGQLGELLVGAQLITHDQLADALIQQSASGQRIGSMLVELGAISERDLAQALSTQLLVPLVDLSQQTPSPEAVEVLAESVARAHHAVPISMDDTGV